MALSISAVPLLFLSLWLSTCYGADPQCVLFNASNVNSLNTTGFNLYVSPGHLTGNAQYNVSVNGTGDFNVTLQAVSSSKSVGSWSNGCNDSLQFASAFPNDTKILAMWISPENLTTVTINAYISNATNTFLISHVLDAILSTVAPTTNETSTVANSTINPANQTSPALTSGNTTVSNMTSISSNSTTVQTTPMTTQTTSITTQTTHMTTQTTSTGSTNHSNLMYTAIQILCLLMISKYLS